MLGSLVGLPFALVARLRGTKPLHPDGAVYPATLRIDGGHTDAELLRRPAEHAAVVRFSRGVGLPQSMPDLFGIAIRLPDVHGPGRHQDFLCVTTVDAPILHHGFVPVTDVQQAPYTSALPYRAGRERILIGVLPLPDSPRPQAPTAQARLRRAAATGRLRFALAIAPLLGRFRRIGELQIGREPLPPEANAIMFNPWNTGGGLEPVGFLNRLRRDAYPAAQQGWGRH
jgi:hypothetical protein